MPIDIFSSKVLGIKGLTKDVKLLKLSIPTGFQFKPGQYLSLSVVNEKGQRIRKPFSIANKPKGVNDFIEFCIKIIPNGLASEYIKKLKLGEEVELFGPAGRFVVSDSSFDKDLIFLASGVGIAPFMSMIPDLLNKGFKKRITLLKSSKTEEDSLYDKELHRLTKEHPNFEFYNIFSHPKNEELDKGYIQDFLEDYVAEDFDGCFYICGLEDMIIDVKAKLASMNFKEEQMVAEKFD